MNNDPVTIRNYTVVKAHAIESLSVFVEELLDQGWKTIGGVAIDSTRNDPIFYQALINNRKETQ